MVVYRGGVPWWCAVVVYRGGVPWWCAMVVYRGGVPQVTGITMEVLRTALEQAKAGRIHILSESCLLGTRPEERRKATRNNMPAALLCLPAHPPPRFR